MKVYLYICSQDLHSAWKHSQQLEKLVFGKQFCQLTRKQGFL